tara:strand:- start:8719 stop:11130 length:2412 start_codon:yes stop_codon:yes gene_type:complete
MADERKEQRALTEELKKYNRERERSVDLSFSMVESLKDVLGVQSKNTEFEKQLLKVSREVNKAIVNRERSFSSIASLNKEIAKSNKTIEKSMTLQRGLSATINANENVAVKTVLGRSEKMKDLQKQINEFNKRLEAGQAIDEKQLEETKKKLALQEDIYDQEIQNLSATEKQYVFNKLNTDELKKQTKEQEELSGVLGVAGDLAEIISKIPGLGSVASDALQEVTQQLQEAQDNGEQLPGTLGVMNMLVGNIGANIMKKLRDPFTILAFAATQVLEAFTAIDHKVSDVAKNLNMGEMSALKTVKSLKATAIASNDLFVNTKGLVESLMEINKTLGTNVMLNKEDLITFTKLREAAGLTNEELMGIQSLSLANGKSLKENTGEFLAQAKITAARQGVALNEKELLKEIASTSAAITVSFGNSADALAEAAATSKALGLNLEQVDAIAGSLLDFESSIANELEAELLLGRDINLEKARQAALDNDLATVAKEIADQVGSSAEFAELNRIQQEKLAQSVGMTREDLAQTLYTQEQLAGATGEEAAAREKKINALIEEHGLAKAQQIIAEEGVENLEDQASATEKLAATMEKLKEIAAGFAAIIYPIVTPIAEMVALIVKFADILTVSIGSFMVLNNLARIKKEFTKEGLIYSTAENALAKAMIFFKGSELTMETALNNIKKRGFFVSLGEMAISAGQAVMKGLAGLGPLGLLAPALGAAAIAGMYALGKTFLGDDVVSEGGMGGYGKRTLLAPEGSIALNDNDTVIAGTNLGGGSGNKETNALLGTLVRQNAKKPQISPVGLYSVQ